MRRLHMPHELGQEVSMAPIKTVKQRVSAKATGLGAIKTLAVVAAVAAGVALEAGEYAGGAAAGAVAVAAYVAYEVL